MKSIVSRAFGVRAVGAITLDGIKTIVAIILAGYGPALVAVAAGKVAHIFIPVIGSLIAAPLSFGGTYLALKLVLDKFEETAIEVQKSLSDDAQSADVVKEPPSKETKTADSKDANNNDKVPI